MARIRTVKPDFWTDEKIVELTPFARLLFIGLWNFCDDDGRMQYSTKKIKMQILPADDVDTHALLTELSVTGLIEVYSVENKEYIQVTNWKKHQTINRPVASKHPKQENTHGVLSAGREGKGRECISVEKASAMHSERKPEKLSTAPPKPEPTEPEIYADPPIAPPPGSDAISTRALELAIMLRKRGASLQASDPNVRRWAQSGISDAQALAALDTATQRRADRCSTQPINSGYLDSIITNSDDPLPDKSRKRSGPPWWSSNDLMIAKASEIGVKPPKPGETWELFRGRINAKLAETAGAT